MKSTTPLHALTSLRFFAAILVVLSHLGFLATNAYTPVSWVAKNVFYEGYMGVTFFFILSGFILSHSYGPRFRESQVTYRAFMVARIARIFPLHLLMLIVALPFAVFGAEKLSGMAALRLPFNVALLQAFVPSEAWYFSFNAPSWSLSVEMFFYALFPLFVLLGSRWLCLLIVVTFAAKLALPSTHFLQYIFPPLRIADFTLGILLHRWVVARGPVPDRLATGSQIASVCLLAVFTALSAGVAPWIRYDIFYMLPMACLVLTFAWQNGALAKAISRPGWLLLGEASFALYLVHWLVIRYGERFRSAAFPGEHPVADLIVAAAYVGGSVAISIALFKLYEIPAKRFVIGRLSRVFLPKVPARSL